MRDSENIINPNCLSVDIATIFFASISFHAVVPAVIEVIMDDTITILVNNTLLIMILNRDKRNVPAVTNVDE